jgi:lipopolysaccharide export system permease protein
MIIFRYLTKEIGSILLATSMILLLIFLSTQFIHYMRSAASGDLSAHAVLLLLSLEIPTLLGTLLPLSLFLGILLGYGRMYADNEMTVLFACGVSQSKLIKITMSLALLVVIIVSGLILWVAPHVNKYAERLLNEGALSPLELVLPGRFQSLQNDRLILYAEEISRDHKHLHNIFIAQPNAEQGQNARSWNILTASSGQQKLDKKTADRFVVLNNGIRYSGIVGEKDYQIINFGQYRARIAQGQNEQERRENAIPTYTLWHDHTDNHAAAELQWRLSIPIMAIILALIAVPLSRVRSRQGRYAQLVPAMLLYIIYGNFMFLNRSWIRNGIISHTFGMWWIHGLMLMIAMMLIVYRFGWWRMVKLFRT